MAIETDKVYNVLKSGGFVRATPAPLTHQTVDGKVEYNYVPCSVKVGVNDIVFSAENPLPADGGYNVVTIDDKATIARLDKPGYFYSGDFGGCVFRLYRGDAGSVYAVHAYNGAKGFADPTQWAQKNGYQLLHEWKSGGQTTSLTSMTAANPAGKMAFGSVIACVTHDRIDVFTFITHSSAQGLKVMRLGTCTSIKNWKNDVDDVQDEPQ
ncbi:MAG: hypothetical protein R3240_10180 [Gammaproteobacteria bacterium]|nr:hypothetical protein [Gammaproteobacteria bacterium]